MFSKFRWNFVFIVLLISIIGFVFFDFFLYYSLKDYLYQQTFHEMRLKTHLAVFWLEQKHLQPLPDHLASLNDITFQIRDIVNCRVTILDSSGRVLTDTDVPTERIQFMDNHYYRPEVQDALKNGWGQIYRESDTIRRKLFYTAFLINYQNKKVGFLRLAYYAANFEASIDKILSSLIIANLVGLAILLISSLVLGALVTIPILQIVRTAQKIAAGNLDKKFSVNRKDEIGLLNAILNQLTERMRGQIHEISYERSKLQNIFTNLDIGIIVVDHQKRVLQANPEIFRILEMASSEIKEQNIVEILFSEPLLTDIGQTLVNNNRNKGELICLRNEHKIFLNYIVIPFTTSESEPTGALIQLHNITELKTLEAIRRDFVANASHELKTPLTAITGYAETLLDGAIDEPSARVKFIRRIREQAQRLEFLIADLLKLSELDRENALDIKSRILNSIIEEVVEDFKDKALQKNIELSLKLAETVKVKIDEEGIRTVFSNLIDNAIKYTPEGGLVTLRMNLIPHNRVRVEVIDTGIGIDRKYHERIFQRFYRVDKARSRSLGGTGLGLAIVKHIIEQHGGKIHIQSELGSGSCFWFELKVG
ncbi:HAMP domain-containing protein [candidate division KSB1 bacterium]|nr:HAMP domain-containing protein [candidate division KSB1 bacterium]